MNSASNGQGVAEFQQLAKVIVFARAVIHGDERGRLLGFPTANMLASDLDSAMTDGVYAGTCRTAAGDIRAVAVSIGHRPTFYGEDAVRLVEAHLVDFSGDLYGTTLELVFQGLLRQQVQFSGIDALKAQLDADVMAVRALFEAGALTTLPLGN